ncbi:MAG: hypothetical protein M3305_15420 [Actinomycetota bacterium]|nr:hypothetical protein [Actinomycetota bacterium]
MTEEELSRFALVLEECERIRTMIAEDEAEEAAALANDASGEIPKVAARMEERRQELAIIAAA